MNIIFLLRHFIESIVACVAQEKTKTMQSNGMHNSENIEALDSLLCIMAVKSLAYLNIILLKCILKLYFCDNKETCHKSKYEFNIFRYFTMESNLLL